MAGRQAVLEPGRVSHPGSFAAAMAEQRAWSDADELGDLIAEQRREMLADGAYPLPNITPEGFGASHDTVALPPRHPVQAPESVYVDVDERVDWVSEARDERASVKWQPLLVRRGERPRVERALKSSDPRAELETLRAKLEAGGIPTRGSRGVTLKRRIARLERATAMLDLVTR